MFKRLLQKLFPPIDEIAVFTMAVAIGVLAIVAPDFRALLTKGLHALLIEGPGERFQQSVWEGVLQFLGGFVLTLVCIGSLIASWYLPFTARRLDGLVQFTVIAHVILVCVANFLVVKSGGGVTGIGDVIGVAIALGSLLYTFLFFLGLRFRLIRIAISDEQASAMQALVAFVSVAALLFFSSVVFDLDWAKCYVLAVVYALMSARLIQSVSAVFTRVA